MRDGTKRTESEEKLRSQSRELALLHRVRRAVAHELEVPGVLSRAVEALAETYGYTWLGAYLLEGGELVLQAGYNEALGRIPLTEGVRAQAIRSGRPLLVEDVSADPDTMRPMEGVTSEICVPLFEEGEAVGLLDLDGRQEPGYRAGGGRSRARVGHRGGRRGRRDPRGVREA